MNIKEATIYTMIAATAANAYAAVKPNIITLGEKIEHSERALEKARKNIWQENTYVLPNTKSGMITAEDDFYSGEGINEDVVVFYDKQRNMTYTANIEPEDVGRKSATIAVWKGKLLPKANFLSGEAYRVLTEEADACIDAGCNFVQSKRNFNRNLESKLVNVFHDNLGTPLYPKPGMDFTPAKAKYDEMDQFFDGSRAFNPGNHDLKYIKHDIQEKYNMIVAKMNAAYPSFVKERAAVIASANAKHKQKAQKRKSEHIKSLKKGLHW